MGVFKNVIPDDKHIFQDSNDVVPFALSRSTAMCNCRNSILFSGLCTVICTPGNLLE